MTDVWFYVAIYGALCCNVRAVCPPVPSAIATSFRDVGDGNLVPFLVPAPGAALCVIFVFFIIISCIGDVLVAFFFDVYPGAVFIDLYFDRFLF